MLNDTPDLDVDAPIPYRLTEYGVLTVAAWRAELIEHPTAFCADCQQVHRRDDPNYVESVSGVD